MLRDLVAKNRSYRRFHQDVAIERATLVELVDLGRLSASGTNAQPLKYVLACDAESNAKVFATLGWAVHVPDWPGPIEGERPSAYIIVLGDTAVRSHFGVDHGIAAQSILLGATEKGLGGCMLGNIQRSKLQEAFQIPTQYEVLLVIALGKPKERVVLEELGSDGDTRYYRDAEGVHHVPKRRLDDIIVG